MHRRTAHHSGFTLVELLVVVAIIAVLSSLLFPVFGQARDKARQAACLSNQKQIAAGLMLYAQDYDETFPSYPFGRDGVIAHPRFGRAGDGWEWSLWVGSLMPYVKNAGVFACPNGPDADAFRRGPAGQRILVHLALNEYVMDTKRYGATLAALSGAANGIAEISLVAESVSPGIYQDWTYDRSVPGKPQPFSLVRLYCPNGVGTTDAACLARHRDHGINIVFADGHARFVPGGRIQGGRGNPRGEYPIVDPNARNYHQSP